MTEYLPLTEAEVGRFLLSVVALLLAAHSLAYLAERLGMPRVAGEIAAGLVLGPSVLGWIVPASQELLFGSQARLLSVLYWLGLALLMFTAGFHVRRGFDRNDRSVMAVLLICGTAGPLIAGALSVQVFDLDGYAGPQGSHLTLTLVMALATAVTSIPVISRIFIDLDIVHTRFAGIVLATATMQDLALWAVLSVATGLTQVPDPSIAAVAQQTFKTVLFLGAALTIGPALIRQLDLFRFNLLRRASRAGFALFICFLLAALSTLLQVNIIFGSFVAGILIGSLGEEQYGEVRQQISAIALAFFVPLYFALVGSRIDLRHSFDAPFVFGFATLSSLVVVAFVAVPLRVSGQSWWAATNFAVAHNTRGGPGIVLASVAYEFGVIGEKAFVAFVLTALATSLAGGAWFRFVKDRGFNLMDEPSSASIGIEGH